jgi:periplasmic protein TonB
VTAAWLLGPAERVAPVALRRPERLRAAASRSGAVRSARTLPLALGVSGLWHGAALALALAAGVFQPGAERDAGPVAEVTLISAAAFEAMISAAPEVAASPPPAPPPVEGLVGNAVAEPDTDIAAVRQTPGALGELGPGEVVPQTVADPAPVPRADHAPRADAPVRPEAPAPEGERPAEVRKPAPRERAAVLEAPSGSGRTASAAGGGETPEVSAGAAKSLLADWGGDLRRKVERARRSPARAAGQTGKVTLRLSVATSGKVLGVAVLRSSGVAALDKAAVDAVRRAGRLPKAPKGLGAASYDFNLPVVFTK